MEYLLSFLLGSLICFILLNRIKKKTKTVKINITRTQSAIYEIIKPAIPIIAVLEKYKEKDSQSRNIENKKTVKVMVVDGLAYWIRDNAVYSATLLGNEIDNSSVNVIDMMGLDAVQLEKMNFIVETLTKGKDDDRGNSGYKKL